MATKIRPSDLKQSMANNICRERTHLGLGGVYDLLDRGRTWNITPTLLNGGSAIFPHAALDLCGHQIAAVVHGVLDSGTDQVLAIGVLHLLNDALYQARQKEKAGEDISKEPLWGIQGPGITGRLEWENEYSLTNFTFLLEQEARRRGVRPPQLIRRYPFLAAGKPHLLPGIKELEEIAKDAVVVATGDLMHHGVGYLTPEDQLVPLETGSAFARRHIQQGLNPLKTSDLPSLRDLSRANNSDAHDVTQVLHHLLGPLQGQILDLTLCDTSEMYRCAPPTWVAASLVELKS